MYSTPHSSIGVIPFAKGLFDQYCYNNDARKFPEAEELIALKKLPDCLLGSDVRVSAITNLSWRAP
jgi:hypothetical protein